MSTRTRFEKEAKGNSEIAYCFGIGDSRVRDLSFSGAQEHENYPKLFYEKTRKQKKTQYSRNKRILKKGENGWPFAKAIVGQGGQK